MEFILPEQGDTNLIDWLYNKRITGDKDLFLNPQLENIHNPSLLNDIEKATKNIIYHVENKHKIYVYGDYDVDGVTATAIVWNFLKKEFNADVMPYIPSRFSEGYGLHEEGIEKIINDGGKLIITVDCGIKDLDLIKKYYKQIDFIITDHHGVTEKTLKNGSKKLIASPYSVANVHPQLNDYPFKDICGAMVAWKLIQYISENVLNNKNYLEYIDLAAIGTVCDVMPLIDENRIVVKHGLKALRNTTNTGLKTSLSTLKLGGAELDVYHLGFVLGPRLNAAGRIDSAMDSLRLLTTQNPTFALELFNKLNSLNQTRQLETKRILEIAEKQAEQNSSKVLIVYGEEWPEGIVGLIAGKLTEKYNKPSIVGSININTSVFKASARSIDEIHITNELAKLSGNFISFGGHAHAAGLSLDIKFLDDFIVKFTNEIDTNFKLKEFTKKVFVDGIVKPTEINVTTLNKIALLSPFGNGNPTPKLLLENIKIKSIQKFGNEKQYTKFITALPYEIISFKEFELAENPTTLSFIGSIGFDTYKKRVNFKVDYTL